MANTKADLLKTGCWHGRSCFIVGGGPSLRHFDFNRLKGELTIGVNRAYEFFSPTIMLALDAAFFDHVLDGTYGPIATRKFNEFDGAKVGVWICKNHVPGVRTFKSLGAAGPIVPIETGIYHGNNSGYSAIALALALGADPVYVLGIDMRYDGDRTHFHDGHPEKTPEKNLVNKCLPHFIALSKTKEGRRVKIVNLDAPRAPFSKLAEYFTSCEYPKPLPAWVADYYKLKDFARRVLRLEA